MPGQSEAEKERSRSLLEPRSDTRPPANDITLRDVAEAANVHVSTVSRALDPLQPGRINAKTAARIRSVAAELGYSPDLMASGLKRRRSSTVGVIVGDFDNPYNGPLMRGLARTLEERGFVALMAESAEDPKRLGLLIEHFISRRVDAIATTAAHTNDDRVLRSVAARSIPVVLGVRNIPGSDLPAVIHDDWHGGELAGRHLRELGHRRVAQLCGPGDIDSFCRRRDGFRSAFDGNPNFVEVSAESAVAFSSMEEGHRLMNIVLADDVLPTAVFVHNDIMAAGALRALNEAGLNCPADISVVGCNDVALSGHLSPPLTTIRLPSQLLGRRLGEALLDRITDPSLPAEEISLPATLVERGSTRPPQS